MPESTPPPIRRIRLDPPSFSFDSWGVVNAETAFDMNDLREATLNATATVQAMGIALSAAAEDAQPVRYRDERGRYISAEEHEQRIDAMRFTEPLDVGDVVEVSDRPFAQRPGDYVSSEFRGATVVVYRINTSYAGVEMETVDVRLHGAVNTINRSCLRLIERAGQPWPGEAVVSGAETTPPAPEVRCGNRQCRVPLASEDDRITVQYTGYGESGCAACTQTCEGCEDVTHLRCAYMLTNIEGEVLCGDCYTCCDHCDGYYPTYTGSEGACPRGCIDREINGYGRTRPSMWLGGPLPKTDDGMIDKTQPGAYYIGFELEVSADRDQSAGPVRDWALANLGNRNALDCKEDSSVEGYEIVSQPMTPAFFESIDWESLMDVINTQHPLYGGEEPTEHGLHVHIGRVAFERDDVATAAYSYLLAQGSHLERIGRRSAYHYCAKVRYPVSAHISQMRAQNGKYTKQTEKVANRGIYAGRDAVNLQNDKTIEVRAFKSTRSANELRDAVRLTYVAAEYIRHLRLGRKPVSPKALHWAEFARWTATAYPEAFASIAGVPSSASNKRELVGAASVAAANGTF